MKKLLPWIVVAIVGLGLYSWGKGFNNTAVGYEADAKTKWANVESAYQRRADLIPNLVATVKGYAEHERETLEGVVQARAQATLFYRYHQLLQRHVVQTIPCTRTPCSLDFQECQMDLGT